MLIAETSAAPSTNQPAKIADLLAGIHLYGLLGFVWFNSVHDVDWRLNNPAAIAAFRRGLEAYGRLCFMNHRLRVIVLTHGYKRSLA